MGLAKDRKAHFPADLAAAAFGGLEGGYAWGPATVGNGALLDHEHAELLFVGLGGAEGCTLRFQPRHTVPYSTLTASTTIRSHPFPHA